MERVFQCYAGLESTEPGGKILYNLLHSEASTHQGLLNLLGGYSILASLIVLIVVVRLYSLYRKFGTTGPVHDAEFERSEEKGNIELRFGLTALLILTILGILSVRLIIHLEPPMETTPAQADLEIVAHQWWWEIRYPHEGVTTANVARIPVGKRMLVSLTSADVVHDWWVPGLGPKMDAIPGRTNYFYLEASRPGTFDGVCNEFCGRQHAWMRITVQAESPQQFEHWLEASRRDAGLPQSASAVRGAQLFQRMSCAGCHKIRGTEAGAGVGPELTHLASRPNILAGRLPYSKQNLRRWLSNPQEVKPGAYMPRFTFSQSELDDLVTYLDGLK